MASKGDNWSIISTATKKGYHRRLKTHCMKAKEIGKSIGVNIDQGGKWQKQHWKEK